MKDLSFPPFESIHEVWVPAQCDGLDFTGYYEVSNLGRVRSIGVWRHYKRRKPFFLEGRILKFGISCWGYNNYQTVNLTRPHHLTVGLHRLIFASFGRTLKDGEQIDHANEVKCDNAIWNLQPMTRSENMQAFWDRRMHKLFLKRQQMKKHGRKLD